MSLILKNLLIFETDIAPLGIATPASYSRLFCEMIYILLKAGRRQPITVAILQVQRKYKVRSNVINFLERNIWGKKKKVENGKRINLT